MKLSETQLREAWRRRWADNASQREPCLTEDGWLRLMAGEASRAERKRAAAHLASCAACAEEYRLLRPLRSWAEDAAQALVAAGSPGSRTGHPGFVSWLSPFGLPATLAACFLLAAVGLGVWNVQLRCEITALHLQSDAGTESAAPSVSSGPAQPQIDAQGPEIQALQQRTSEQEQLIARLRRDLDQATQPSSASRLKRGWRPAP